MANWDFICARVAPLLGGESTLRLWKLSLLCPTRRWGLSLSEGSPCHRADITPALLSRPLSERQRVRFTTPKRAPTAGEQPADENEARSSVVE